MRNLSHAYRSQGGSALVISLIVLLIVTVFGLAAMQSSILQVKLSTSAKERNRVFAAAESALRVAEQRLVQQTPGFDDLHSLCTGSTCFTPDCTEGLCFGGEYELTDIKKIDCEAVHDGDVEEQLHIWEKHPSKTPAVAAKDFWNDTSNTIELSVAGLSNPVQYIIEFVCYVDSGAGDGTVAFDRDNDGLGLPLYRITSLAQANNGGSKVMLQSTFMAKL